MVWNYGKTKLNDPIAASAEAKEEFSKIFATSDFLQGGGPYYHHVIHLLGLTNGVAASRHSKPKLVDLGFGRGFFLRELEDKGLELYGVDFAEGARTAADKVLKSAKLFVSDIHKTPFDADVFDFVTCLGVIEHLVDPSAGVREAARILKNDGLAVFTIPNTVRARISIAKQRLLCAVAKVLHVLHLRKKEAIHVRQPIDRFYTPGEGRKLLEANGLQVMHVQLLRSKRDSFALLHDFKDRPIHFVPAYLTADFALYVCRKNR